MITRDDKVRELPFCIVCGNPKSHGLRICWPCHHTLKARHDGSYGSQVEKLLANVQHTLELDQPRSEPCHDTK